MAIKHLLLFLSLASSTVLGSALIGQYGFSLYPCELCIYQRWPHGLVIAIGIIYYLRSSATKALRRTSGGLQSQPSTSKQMPLKWFDNPDYYLGAMCISLLIGAGIAGYHAGVEWEIFEGPDACSSDGGNDMSLEELRAQIAGAALVSCKQAMAYIFGLSMAVWNALVSIGLVGVVLFLRGRQTDVSSSD